MNTCIVALPHGLDPALARDLGFDIDGLASRTIPCVLHVSENAEQSLFQSASLTPCKLLARLFQSGNQNAADSERRQAIVEADTLIVLAGIGQFDDDVWTPVIARLLEAREQMPTAAKLVFAWTGLEPFLMPYEAQAIALSANPQLAAGLLPSLERVAPALAHLLRNARDNAEAALLTRIASLSSRRNDSDEPALDIVFR
jgi:hypothetical protein